jgi:hypothetical protein
MSVLCSRNARPGKDKEGAARCPHCSQNVHDKTVLVRCAQSRAALATPLKNSREKKPFVGHAQWKINQPPSPYLYRAFLEHGTSVGVGSHPRR